MAAVAVRWVTGFIDSPDRSTEAFWAAVTSSQLSARRGDGRFATLLPADGDPYLRVQVTDDGPPGNHLDLHVPDIAPAVDAARGLGAQQVHAEDGLVVLRSPAGLPFCVVGWSGEATRPGPVDDALVDQMCLDIPAAVFEAEAGFWGELTGWARRPTDIPEFDFLERGEGLALRLLLQRTGAEHAGMHLDLAAADVAATVARHEALGASVVRRVPDDWTTLRDPSGREYCVTARWPG